jgi:hypothetical protein
MIYPQISSVSVKNMSTDFVGFYSSGGYGTSLGVLRIEEVFCTACYIRIGPNSLRDLYRSFPSYIILMRDFVFIASPTELVRLKNYITDLIITTDWLD